MSGGDINIVSKKAMQKSDSDVAVAALVAASLDLDSHVYRTKTSLPSQKHCDKYDRHCNFMQSLPLCQKARLGTVFWSRSFVLFYPSHDLPPRPAWIFHLSKPLSPDGEWFAGPQ